MLNKGIVKLIQQVAQKWQTDLALPFATVLPAATIVTAAALENIAFRERFFSTTGNSLGLLGSGLE